MESADSYLFAILNPERMEIFHQTRRRIACESDGEDPARVLPRLQEPRDATLHRERLSCPWTSHNAERAIVGCCDIPRRSGKSVVPAHDSCSLNELASCTRSSPEISLGSSVSRRAARARDTWMDAMMWSTTGRMCEENAFATFCGGITTA